MNIAGSMLNPENQIDWGGCVSPSRPLYNYSLNHSFTKSYTHIEPDPAKSGHRLQIKASAYASSIKQHHG